MSGSNPYRPTPYVKLKHPDMNGSVLADQIEYYRARAQEYDASIAGAADLLVPGKDLLLNLGQFDQILELACGTGIWTEMLLRMGNEVTAVDAAPEMLEIARRKLGEERIKYRQADLFHWKPDRQYGSGLLCELALTRPA